MSHKSAKDSAFPLITSSSSLSSRNFVKRLGGRLTARSGTVYPLVSDPQKRYSSYSELHQPWPPQLPNPFTLSRSSKPFGFLLTKKKPWLLTVRGPKITAGQKLPFSRAAHSAQPTPTAPLSRGLAKRAAKGSRSTAASGGVRMTHGGRQIPDPRWGFPATNPPNPMTSTSTDLYRVQTKDGTKGGKRTAL